MEKYGIVQTDNYGRDYPNESFVTSLPYLRKIEDAEALAKCINKIAGEDNERYWKVVKMPYELAPGFEP